MRCEKSAILLQATARGFIARTQYKRTRNAAIVLQMTRRISTLLAPFHPYIHSIPSHIPTLPTILYSFHPYIPFFHSSSIPTFLTPWKISTFPFA